MLKSPQSKGDRYANSSENRKFGDGRTASFQRGKGVYHVEALVEVIQKADELNGRVLVVKIIEITARATAITAQTYAAGKNIIPAPEELFVVTPDE